MAPLMVPATPPTTPPHTHENSSKCITEHFTGLTDGVDAIGGPTFEILDIRDSETKLSVENEIFKGLRGNETGHKTLPTLLLYSAEGLKLFEEITYLDEYYLTNAEIEVLEQYATRIADRIQDGSVVVELGSGNLRKVNILLMALDRMGKHIDYYALDLDRSELERTLSLVQPDTFKHVRVSGLHGTYDDGRMWLKNDQAVRNRPRCILWLGSSAGNLPREDAASFLRTVADDAIRPGYDDFMLVGLDGCKEPEKVWAAYNDRQRVTERFIMSGLKQANTLLQGDYFKANEWDYLGEWNTAEGRHQAYYVPRRNIKFAGKLGGVKICKGERINIEYSYKFDKNDQNRLWNATGLKANAEWTNSTSDYHLTMLHKPAFQFSLQPKEYAPEPAPTVSEWEELWKAWDHVTLGMVPKDQLLSKPIDLRNPCIFYLGHIPTFLDVQIVRGTGEAKTEPESYYEIFQRGIDPDVDNPDDCHAHSMIPDTWPQLSGILEYQNRIRARAKSFYGVDGSAKHQPMLVQRALFVAFEHECMHLETLLYMLLQTDTTLPPPGVVKPDFEALRKAEIATEAEAEWIQVPSCEFAVGISDPEDPEDQMPHFFGWDNEKPIQATSVASFLAKSHPISNLEYATYLFETSQLNSVPSSWVATAAASKATSLEAFLSSLAVRTFFGPISIHLAADWPIMASYVDLESCAAFYGGRVPTANEVRALSHYAEQCLTYTENMRSHLIDAVNGHLVHNGVCESPPSSPSVYDAARTGLYRNLAGKNVGFVKWHASPGGGAWEWTSTEFQSHSGFKESKLYPEYSKDFFDGKHYIVLGGSWATHPRIAGRKSFVNWYHRSYPYMWCTARIVKDVN